MKKIGTMIVCITLVLLAAACGKNGEVSLKPGIYTLQDAKRDVPGDFTITIYEDGTFEYYETPISSYIGRGHYFIEEDIVTFKEDQDGGTGNVNDYQMADGNLLFIQDDSANYHFVTLEEGAVFAWTSEIQ
ncbi:MAG: hypothetical protein HFH15_07455 [Ruminococcus sp.]|jgi:hypothetical protein|nr:hypothetical protein [Ruminococcus sp.]